MIKVLNNPKGRQKFSVKKNAELELFLIEEKDCENSIEVSLNADSRVKIFTFCLSGRIKNTLTVNLSGKNSSASIYGLSLLDGDEIMENYVLLRHSVGETESRQSYKSILKGRSMSIFNGKIRVEKGADKSKAYQLNKNILLSDEATAKSKPELEILADDVKCSHGATTGRLDDAAIFYLQSRGISENEARKILIEAFVEDLISGISDKKIRKNIQNKIDKKLKI